LAFSELYFYHQALTKEDEDKEKMLMRQAGFITWSMGAGGEKTFEKYMTDIGLFKKRKPLNKQQVKAMAEKGHDNAKKILDRLRKAGEKRKGR
jgi:hypothetical protein